MTMTIVYILVAVFGLLNEGCAPTSSPTAKAQAADPAISQPADPAAATPTPTPSPTATPQPTATPVPTATPIALTYYSLSETVNNANNTGHSYTVVGSCVNYLTKVYCWDDGVKTIDFTVNNFRYGPYTYTYWGLMLQNGHLALCNGGCGVDAATSPIVMSASVIADVTQNAVNTVFNTGTSHQVSCTLSGQLLNCIDFEIDLSQVPF